METFDNYVDNYFQDPQAPGYSPDLFYTDLETRCAYPRPFARGGGGSGGEKKNDGETNSYDDAFPEDDTSITRYETFSVWNPETKEWEVKSKRRKGGLKPRQTRKRRDQQNTRW